MLPGFNMIIWRTPESTEVLENRKVSVCFYYKFKLCSPPPNASSHTQIRLGIPLESSTKG